MTGCNDELHVSFYLQVLQNIELYLEEEERRMIKQDQECKYFMLIYCLLPRPKTLVTYEVSQETVLKNKQSRYWPGVAQRVPGS